MYYSSQGQTLPACLLCLEFLSLPVPPNTHALFSPATATATSLCVNNRRPSAHVFAMIFARSSLSLSLSLATSLHSNWRRTRACCVWMWPCVGQNDGWNDRARDAATYAACVQRQRQLLLQHAGGGTVPRRTAAAALRPAGRPECLRLCRQCVVHVRAHVPVPHEAHESTAGRVGPSHWLQCLMIQLLLGSSVSNYILFIFYFDCLFYSK